MIITRQLLCLALGTFVVFSFGCEPLYDLHLKLDESQMPATFSFLGHSHAYGFEILQLPRTEPLSKTNPFNFTGETIWKVSPSKELKANDWPVIKYGQVPSGFSQATPSQGAPPTLDEGKLYVARITENKDSQMALFFEIRRGKPVNVSDQVLGP